MQVTRGPTPGGMIGQSPRGDEHEQGERSWNDSSRPHESNDFFIFFFFFFFFYASPHSISNRRSSDAWQMIRQPPRASPRATNYISRSHIFFQIDRPLFHPYKLIARHFCRERSRASPLRSASTSRRHRKDDEVPNRNTNREIARPRIVIKASQHARLTDLAENARRQGLPVADFLLEELSRAHIVADDASSLCSADGFARDLYR